MKTWQKVGLVLVVIALPVLIGAYSLGMFKIFGTATENVRRGIFESTKSYTHGVQQDLGKYLEEYNKTTDPAEREAIRQVVKGRFPSIPADNIQNETLREFLINMRGF